MIAAKSSIACNLRRVREEIEAAAVSAGRHPSEIALCVVSKFRTIEEIDEAYEAGVRIFGESRVQEMADKFQDRLAHYDGAEVHMIGHLQRNKAKKAAAACVAVQSVDSAALVDALEKAAAEKGQVLRILFEINSGEEAKNGFLTRDALWEAAEKALSCKNLRIEGIMTMAPFTENEKIVRAAFKNAYETREAARHLYPNARWDTLSMGMSGDFRAAIAEGSTMVRIGEAVFGAR